MKEQKMKSFPMAPPGKKMDQLTIPERDVMYSARLEKARIWALLLPLLLFCASNMAWAQGAGKVTHLSGVIAVTKASGESRIISVDSVVEQGDVLSTQDDTYARIKFTDGSEMVMRPNSRLEINAYSFDKERPQEDNVLMRLLKGGLRSVTGLIGKRNKENVSFETPSATIGIRGTHFSALVCQGDCFDITTAGGEIPRDGTHVDVVSGAVNVRNAAGSTEVRAGQFGYVASPEVVPSIVPPASGVSVTMPSSISTNRGTGQGIGASKANECVVSE